MYKAILLDVDGTLIDDQGTIRDKTRSILHAVHARGVHVMISTGRSEGGTRPILEDLGIPNPAVVFNGAAVFCPTTDKLIEERVLSNRVVDRALALGARDDHMTVVSRTGEKVTLTPRDEIEGSAVRDMEDMNYVATRDEYPTEYLSRITFLSRAHTDSAVLYDEVERALDLPAYLTHFPLNALPMHRTSPFQVVDVQPPCRGKGEAVRWLNEVHGFAPESIVAVGDATNDIPMFEAAGLAVAMGNAMPEAKAAADRVIGSNNSDALADLIEELFGG